MFAEFLFNWFSICELKKQDRSYEYSDKLRASFGKFSLPNGVCSLLKISKTNDNDEYRNVKTNLERASEWQPRNPTLWFYLAHMQIQEGEFDQASESARRLEALPSCRLIERLIAAQAAAATMTLHRALDVFGTTLQVEDI